MILMKFSQVKIYFTACFILISGCAGSMLQPVPPDVEITNVELSGINFPATKVMFSLLVSNPNDFDIDISYIDMRLHVNDYLMTSERWTNIAVLFSHQKRKMRIPVNIDLANALTILPQLMTENKIPYDISGTVKLKNRGKELSFSYKGEFHTNRLNGVRLNDMVDYSDKKSFRF